MANKALFTMKINKNCVNGKKILPSLHISNIKYTPENKLQQRSIQEYNYIASPDKITKVTEQHVT